MNFELGTLTLESGFRTPDSPERPRALLVAVEAGQGPWDVATSLRELAGLCESAGLEPVAQVSQRLAHPHPTHYVGRGKLEEIRERVALDAVDVIVADDELPSRVRANLEERLGKPALDRTTVILDIFAQRARTHEGRIQVELAQYEFLLPRLVGWGRAFSRLGGGVGTRGPGETQLEVDRRRVRQRLTVLRREIEQIRQHRRRLRRRRQQAGLPLVALVGYTNVGKTTLLQGLTSSADGAVANAPFVTLDPLSRVMSLASGQQILVSDTVGFISKLPATLVAAFRATLEELHQADLLVHVLDITDDRLIACADIVSSMLGELGLEDKPLIPVLNKADAVNASTAQARALLVRARGGGDGSGSSPEEGIVVSARTGMGLEALRVRIEERLEAGSTWIRVRIPYERTDLVDLFYRRGRPARIAHGPEGTDMEGLLPNSLLGPFQAYRAGPAKGARLLRSSPAVRRIRAEGE